MNSANATRCLPMGPYTCKGTLVERNALNATVLELDGKMCRVYRVRNETRDLAIRESTELPEPSGSGPAGAQP